MPNKKSTSKSKSVGQSIALFTDRDGVLNEGANIDVAADFKLLPGIAKAIKSLKVKGVRVIVVSNQGGIAEDLQGKVVWKKRPLTREALAEIHAEMLRQLGKGAAPDLIKFCPHSKSVNCPCRKPQPAMLLEAAKELNIDLSRSFMVGDRATDVEAGINAGVTPILVLSGIDKDQKDLVPPGTIILPTFVEVAALVLERLSNS